MSLQWFGYLTTVNIEQVAGLLRQLLEGKKFTSVHSNEGCGFRPEVRTGQTLKTAKNEPAITVYHHEAVAALTLRDSYGVWSCQTTLTEDVEKEECRDPYFEFERNKVTIIDWAPAGWKIYHVLAVEPPPTTS